MRGWVIAWACASLTLAACGDDDGPADDARWTRVLEDLDGGLMSVWGTSADNVWISGANGTVLHFDGAKFHRLDPGVTSDLWWVFGFEDGPVFFGGSNGQILEYAGGEFTVMDTPTNIETVYGIWGSAPDDLWAVGGTNAMGSAFAWRYDGDAWTVQALPEMAQMAQLFKVHGQASDDAWLVGAEGVMLHWDGEALTPVEGPAEAGERTLFTVHTEGERVVAVGGFGSGVLIERATDGEAFIDATPAGAMQLNGVYLTPDGGYASGTNGSILRYDGDEWAEEVTDLESVETLHAVYVDPTGGVWAVGGQILAPPLTDGLVIHRGDDVPNVIEEE